MKRTPAAIRSNDKIRIKILTNYNAAQRKIQQKDSSPEAERRRRRGAFYIDNQKRKEVNP
jgi:hypothetical protein